MTRPYSTDLRKRAVALVEGGQSRHQVAKLFKVGVSSVVRWCRRQRVTGTCAAKPMGGRRRAVLLEERNWLVARLSAAPDLTVRGLQRELGERGVKVSYGAVWAFLAAEGLTFKKNSVRRRARTARRRTQARPLATLSGADRR
jgi:transposase